MKTCIAFLLLFPMTIHAQQPLSLDEARPIVEQLQRGMSTLQTVNLEFVQ